MHEFSRLRSSGNFTLIQSEHFYHLNHCSKKYENAFLGSIFFNIESSLVSLNFQSFVNFQDWTLLLRFIPYFFHWSNFQCKRALVFLKHWKNIIVGKNESVCKKVFFFFLSLPNYFTIPDVIIIHTSRRENRRCFGRVESIGDTEK